VGPNKGAFFLPGFRRDHKEACLALTKGDNREDRRCTRTRNSLLEEQSISFGRETRPLKKLPQSLTVPIDTKLEKAGAKGAIQKFDRTFGPHFDRSSREESSTSTTPPAVQLKTNDAENSLDPNPKALISESFRTINELSDEDLLVHDLEPRPIEEMMQDFWLQ
jgi:hypothetical protein